MTGYSASKFGLRGFSESLRGELNQWPGIHVCDLFPAFLDTPGMQHAGNYTGKALRPAPPVYDPQRVAKKMVSLALYPKQNVVVGSAALFLRFAHFLLPDLSSTITAKVMQSYFKNAEASENTSGNLFNPVEYGTSIHGGWNKPVVSRGSKITAVMVIAGILAGWAITGRNR
jgi:NAD(P)-dependent dehydrogenase (short-subunit alcohol dehydrogenase family)